MFALYYILTKMGILSDGASHFANKQEIELVNSETTKTHQQRMAELKKAMRKEKQTERWGIIVKAFSWMASTLGIISGIVLVATGVGVVAGAMLIAGGIIQMASQIMEMSGGWAKVAELLPGDDIEKKRVVISWMQIGITVLCMILAGASVVWGGYSYAQEALGIAQSAMSAVAIAGHGMATIGEGISSKNFKTKLSEVKHYEIELAKLKNKRQDLMEQVEWATDRLEQFFEDLAHALEFEIEIFRADQLYYRR